MVKTKHNTSEHIPFDQSDHPNNFFQEVARMVFYEAKPRVWYPIVVNIDLTFVCSVLIRWHAAYFLSRSLGMTKTDTPSRWKRRLADF
jgi:hypothetical protein